MRRFTGDRLVLASHNAGKLREIAALVEPLGITAVSGPSLGLAVPEETEESFAGNAAIKARAAALASGLPALSDDSGIAVAALGGAPGVHTADWAEAEARSGNGAGAGNGSGNGRDYPAAMARVHALLQARRAPLPRRAAFVCALCLAWPDGHAEAFEGRIEGSLCWPPRGGLGFGFDPMFVPDGHARSFGEMDPALKHAISHRARAFAQLLAGPLAR